jgi:hypothetical protein
MKTNASKTNANNPSAMRNLRHFLPLVVIAVSAVSCTPSVLAQNGVLAQAASSARPTGANADLTLPDAPSAQQTATTPSTPSDSDGQQTKRILGIIPNFRSVSVDTKLPPLSPGNKFKLMLQDSFDYSSFIYVGILAGVAQAQNSYPEFHQGAAGYGRYYWHSFADNVGGNLMTEAVVPTLTREDPRYYTLGSGGFMRRTGYAISRLLVTRTDGNARSPNISEIVGNGAAAGIANLYYPSQERTWTKTGQRWLTQVSLDGASNLVKEYWPDINSKIFRRKH